MFQFPAFAPTSWVTCLQHAGFPHSEISGSKVVCTYPKLIAAYHVLLRLLEPRHPPFALAFFFYSLTLSPKIKTFGGPVLPERRNMWNCNAMFIVLHCELNFCSLIFCFYIQYVKDQFHVRFTNVRCTIYFSTQTVENNGFEPLTPCLQSRCSSQLS